MDEDQLLIAADRIGVGTMRLYLESWPEPIGMLDVRVPVRLLQSEGRASPLGQLRLCLPPSLAEQLLEKIPPALERLHRKASQPDH